MASLYKTKGSSQVGNRTALQRMFFTRWVNQKLVVGRYPEIKDVVTDLNDGVALVNLISSLSEKKYPKKLKTKPMRPIMMEQCSRALDFCWKQGVIMNSKPAALQMVNGEERPILALVWAIMMKFLRFGDPDDPEASKLTAEESLLMWVKNQLDGYGLDIKNFTTSFRNGIAYAALIHKFRPNYINPKDMDAKDAVGNLTKVFAAAERYFGLPQYIKPTDVALLDKQSAFIYLGEYYYGIAAQRKTDLACRRIAKLITYTTINDALREEFVTKADKLEQWMEEVTKTLNDRTIDNTMAGARHKLGEFNEYKSNKKPDIVNYFLKIETLYNHLAMRLVEHKRPAFKPKKPVAFFSAQLKQLEITEKERQVALVAELNRQVRLVSLNEQHEARFAKLDSWGAAKKEYLAVKENVTTTGEAEYQINRLNTYKREAKDVSATSVAELRALGAELVKELFEHKDAVLEREAKIEALFTELEAAAVKKMEILEDDLARLKVREATHLVNGQHKAKHAAICEWAQDKRDYLNTKEATTTTAEATLQLTILDSFTKDKKLEAGSSVVALKQIGKSIMDTKYESKLSSWTFETPEEIAERETDIEKQFAELDTHATEKKAVLDDDLARLKVREATHLINLQHKQKHASVTEWCKERAASLRQKDEVATVREATTALNRLMGLIADKNTEETTTLPFTKDIGKQVLTTTYKSERSEWTFETPEEIKEREADLDKQFAELEELSTEKKAVLEDDLARLKVREDTHQVNEQHKAKQATVNAWIAAKREYLKTKENVTTAAAAELQLNILAGFVKDKAMEGKTTISFLKEVGQSILAAKYESKRSSWTFETPAEVTEREAEVDKQFAELDELAAEKKLVLEDDLARLKVREATHLLNCQHKEKHSNIMEWCNVKAASLRKKEVVETTSDATLQLSLLDSLVNDKKVEAESTVVAFKNIGQKVLTTTYKSERSEWSFETPEEVNEREAAVEKFFVELEELAVEKKAVLDDDLARLKVREDTHQVNEQHKAKHETINDWIAAKREYLKTKEDVPTAAAASLQLNILAGVVKDKKMEAESTVVAFKSTGQTILTTEYKSERSAWTFETPDEVKEREADIDKQFAELEELAVEKKAVLDDDLARLKVREATHQVNEQHKAKHDSINTWIAAKRTYLKTKEEVAKTSDVALQLNILAAFMKDKNMESGSTVVAFKTIGQKVLTTTYKSERSEWTFETPEEVKDREAGIDKQFAELEELATEKKAVLDDDLARLEVREETHLLNLQHKAKHASIAKWVAGKKAYLEAEEKIDSVPSAQLAISVLDAFVSDKKLEAQSALPALATVGKSILDTEYKSERSSWTFETPEEVKEREADMDKQFAELDALAIKKKEILDAALAAEVEKERLRLQFATQAQEFDRWAETLNEDLAASHFGFDLPEVEAFAEKLATADGATNNSRKEKQDAYTDTLQQAKDRQAGDENPYTTFDADQLSKVGESVEGAMGERKGSYDSELKTMRANDALCCEFAAAADAVVSLVDKSKGTVTNSEAALEEQLAALEGMQKEDRAVQMDAVHSLQGKLDEAGVKHNVHCQLSAKDVDVISEQYDGFLQSKATQLRDEIAHRQLKGLTTEQYDEIKRQFSQFDTDDSQSLNLAEFKSCLYSLGEEKPTHEVRAIMAEHGATGDEGKKTINYDGFEKFMITQLGDSDTQDEIEDGFRLISKNADVAQEEQIRETPLNDEHVKYFLDTAPKKEEGYEYSAWTKDIFSR